MLATEQAELSTTCSGGKTAQSGMQRPLQRTSGTTPAFCSCQAPTSAVLAVAQMRHPVGGADRAASCAKRPGTNGRARPGVARRGPAAACAVSGTLHGGARRCVYQIPPNWESLRGRAVACGKVNTDQHALGANRGAQGHRRRRLVGHRDASAAVRVAFATHTEAAVTPPAGHGSASVARQVPRYALFARRRARVRDGCASCLAHRADRSRNALRHTPRPGIEPGSSA